MRTKNYDNSPGLKRKIKHLESVIEKEPVMFFFNSGRIWISERARNKLAERKISSAEIIEWLKIGIKHLTKASYGCIDTLMIQLPHNHHGSEVLVVLRDNKQSEIPPLTSTEKKVLKYLVRGLSNKGIASSLNIRPGTVNAHLDNIYRKLNVSNRVAAICSALKSGLVVPAA